MNENFLITWEESGDETHFMMFPISEYQKIKTLIGKLSNRKISVNEVDKLIIKVRKKSVKDFSIQIYCDEPWPFINDNIQRIISLPEFGW